MNEFGGFLARLLPDLGVFARKTAECGGVVDGT
jgi:hypothetical protein